RPSSLSATGPTSTPASRRRRRASRPASSGTSRTSCTMPVAVMKLACGWWRAQRSIWARSVVDCVCQAKDTGCRAGVGQPTRSQEQRYPAGWAAGARGSPAPAAASSRASRPPSSAAGFGRRPRSHWVSLPCLPVRPPNSALIYPLASPSCFHSMPYGRTFRRIGGPEPTICAGGTRGPVPDPQGPVPAVPTLPTLARGPAGRGPGWRTGRGRPGWRTGRGSPGWRTGRGRPGAGSARGEAVERVVDEGVGVLVADRAAVLEPALGERGDEEFQGDARVDVGADLSGLLRGAQPLDVELELGFEQLGDEPAAQLLVHDALGGQGAGRRLEGGVVQLVDGGAQDRLQIGGDVPGVRDALRLRVLGGGAGGLLA